MARTRRGTNGTITGKSTVTHLEDTGLIARASISHDRQFAHLIREAAHSSSAVLPEGRQDHPGYREITALPATLEPTRFSRDTLLQALLLSSSRSGAAFFPHAVDEWVTATSEGYEYAAVASENGTEPTLHWQIRRSGFVYRRATMLEDDHRISDDPFLSLDTTVAHITEAVDYLGRLYASLVDPEERITMIFRFGCTQGRTVSPSPASHAAPLTCRQTEVVYETTQSAGTLRARRATIATEAVRDILQQFNWINPPMDTLRSLVDTHLTRTIYRHFRPAA